MNERTGGMRAIIQWSGLAFILAVSLVGMTSLASAQGDDEKRTPITPRVQPELPVTITIDLPAGGAGTVFNLDEPPRVLVENCSSMTVWMWTAGMYEDLNLHWEFVNERTREIYVPDGRIYLTDMLDRDPIAAYAMPAEATGDDIRETGQRLEPGEKIAQYPRVVQYDEVNTRQRIPLPNTPESYSVTAVLSLRSPRVKGSPQPLTGVVRSQTISVKLVSPETTTPQEYVARGFEQVGVDLCRRDPKLLNEVDGTGETPLTMAIQKNLPEAVVALLLLGADVNVKNGGEEAPLHLVRTPELARLILAAKPQLNIRTMGDDQQTALKIVLERLQYRISKIEHQHMLEIAQLLVDAGAEYDLKDIVALNDHPRLQQYLRDHPESLTTRVGESPLRVAAEAGNVELCEYLLEHFQLDVEDRGDYADPILRSTLDYPEVVKLLIRHGADVNQRIKFFGGRSGMWVVEDNATVLHYAAENAPVETVTALLDSGVDVLAIDDPGGFSPGRTALEVAALYGRFEVIVAITRHRAWQRIDRQQRERILDLCLLEAGGFRTDGRRSFGLGELLLAGANPNAFRNGETVLAKVSSSKGDVESLQEVRKSVETLIQHGAKPELRAAICLGDVTWVRHWIAENAPANPRERFVKIEDLAEAVRRDRFEILKLLLPHCDVNARLYEYEYDKIGTTALHIAATQNRIDAAHLLIAAGADLNARDRSNWTPLFDAISSRHSAMIRLLLAAGSDRTLTDKEGRTAVEFARDRQYSADLILAAFGEVPVTPSGSQP